MKIALIIPTLNAGDLACKFIDAFKSQKLKPQKVIVIDSGSTDNTLKIFGDIATDIYKIDKRDFNHGLTRNVGIDKVRDFDIAIFMSQDAILANEEAFYHLTKHFEDLMVGATYGRQLPRKEANPIEAHARLFNYPDKTIIKSKEDIKHLGIKVAFGSNSFSAFSIKHLLEVNGFPYTILSEETYVLAKLILKNYKIVYESKACVYHSHGYSIKEEFKRYFDTGVFHAQNPWIMQTFGKAQDEGKKFVKSEIRHLLKENPKLIPEAILRDISKYIAFKMGLKEKYIPKSIKKKLSMHKSFWE